MTRKIAESLWVRNVEKNKGSPRRPSSARV
jgi:hypothetical protein